MLICSMLLDVGLGWQATLEERAEECDRLEKLCSGLNAKLQTRSSEFSSLSQQVQRLQEDKTTLESKLVEVSTKLDETSAHQTALTTQHEELVKHHAMLQIDHEHTHKALQVEKEEKTKLLAQNTTLKAQTDERFTECEDVQRKSLYQIKEAQTMREQAAQQVRQILSASVFCCPVLNWTYSVPVTFVSFLLISLPGGVRSNYLF